MPVGTVTSAIIMNPTMKTAWFQERRGDHPIRSTWLRDNVLPALKEVWLQEYRGKSSSTLPAPTSEPHHHRSRSPKRYTSCREHKRFKLSHVREPGFSGPDELDEYLATNVLIITSALFGTVVACHLRLLLFSCPEPRIALHFPCTKPPPTALL